MLFAPEEVNRYQDLRNLEHYADFVESKFKMYSTTAPFDFEISPAYQEIVRISDCITAIWECEYCKRPNDFKEDTCKSCGAPLKVAKV